MEKITFSRSSLLEGYKKFGDTGQTKVQLENNNVRIMLSISGEKDIELVGLHKKKGVTAKRIARCALFVLLKQILEDKLVNESSIVKVKGVEKDSEGLIEVYKEIGFTHVLFYATTMEDYNPSPSSSGEIALTKGESVAIIDDKKKGGWYGGYRLNDPERVKGWFSSHFVKRDTLTIRGEGGSPINLNATVQELIETLEKQCEMTGGGRKRKKSKKKKKYKKKKKSKRKK